MQYKSAETATEAIYLRAVLEASLFGLQYWFNQKLNKCLIILNFFINSLFQVHGTTPFRDRILSFGNERKNPRCLRDFVSFSCRTFPWRRKGRSLKFSELFGLLPFSRECCPVLSRGELHRDLICNLIPPRSIKIQKNISGFWTWLGFIQVLILSINYFLFVIINGFVNWMIRNVT